MLELDIVRDLAKQALTIRTLTEGLDNSLWDRAQRLVRNVEYIWRLPELTKAGLSIDRFCLITATYFNDAGLARYLQTHSTAAKSTFTAKSASSNANNVDLMAFSAKVIGEKLSGAVEKAKIEKINRIITESSGRFTRMTEAMILSDARNLDDMGATGIFNEFRQYVIGGKGVSEAVQNWQKKIDYRYWQARLKKSFRFESVRRLAERRLFAADSFMNQLKVENTAVDLEELVT